MPRSYKIEGIVIRRVNYSESDRLITIFSKSQGKIVVLAKGIRKVRSRKAPHLELFTHAQLFIAHGRNFDLVTESQTIEPFSLLRSDLIRLAHSYRIIEIVDRLCMEREIHKDVYHFLLGTLAILNSQNLNNPHQVTEQFTLQILWNLGYLPKENVIEGYKLQNFLESIMERRLKSDSLLTKVSVRL